MRKRYNFWCFHFRHLRLRMLTVLRQTLSHAKFESRGAFLRKDTARDQMCHAFSQYFEAMRGRWWIALTGIAIVFQATHGTDMTSVYTLSSRGDCKSNGKMLKFKETYGNSDKMRIRYNFDTFPLTTARETWNMVVNVY